MDDGGTVSRFPAPASGQITSGPDGALWFVAGGSVGRMTTAGDVTLLTLPPGLAASGGLAVGADHAVWVGAGGRVGRGAAGGAGSRLPPPARPHAARPFPAAGGGGGAVRGPPGRP